MSDALVVDDLTLSILRWEETARKLPQAECPITNDFCHGLYARTMDIPAGTLLTGAIHKDESFFVVRAGEIILTTPDGPVRVGPGYMGITKAGSKRAGLALTDVVFTTFHANPEEVRDEKEIWENFTLPPPQDVLERVKEETKWLSE